MLALTLPFPFQCSVLVSSLGWFLQRTEDPNSSTTSWESGAVIAYLLRTYDTSHILFPPPSSSPQLLIDFDKWTAFLLSTLGPMLGQVNWYRHYNPTSNEDALHRYEAQTYRCFDVLEGQLKKSEGASVLQGGFGAVDCHFWPWVKQYAFAGLSLDKYPLIQKWLRTVGEREEVKAAYKKVEEVAKA